MFVTDPEDCYYTKKVCDLHVRNILCEQFSIMFELCELVY